MSNELRQMLELLFECFEMQDGEWPSTHVFSSVYGRVWGPLPDEVVEVLQAIQLQLEEEEIDE